MMSRRTEQRILEPSYAPRGSSAPEFSTHLHVAYLYGELYRIYYMFQVAAAAKTLLVLSVLSVLKK